VSTSASLESLTPSIEHFETRVLRGNVRVSPAARQRHGASSEVRGTQFKRCTSGHREGRRTEGAGRSRAEAVEGAALALERVDDVERGDGLALGVLGVGDRVADDVLEEAARSAEGDEDDRRTS